MIPWLKRIAKQTANVNVSTETCDLVVQNAPNLVLVAGEDVSSFTSEEPSNKNVSMKNDTSENEGGEDELEEPDMPEESIKPGMPEEPSKPEELIKANEEPDDKPVTREDVIQSLL